MNLYQQKKIQTHTHIKHQTGAALVEWFVVALPVFTFLGLGAYQWLTIYEAKATINHAAFMAIRKGALYNGDPDIIKGALAEYMAPLYAPASGNTADLSKVVTGLSNPVSVLINGKCPSSTTAAGQLRTSCQDVTGFSQVRTINPTKEAFTDFAEDIDEDGKKEEIPNTNLSHRSTEKGNNSGVNIQDANLLKVEVVYGYPLTVPFVNKIIPFVSRKFQKTNSFEDNLLQEQRIPIRISSIVRMQTPIKLNSTVLSKSEAEGIIDELQATNSENTDINDRPWCGATGDCDVADSGNTSCQQKL